MLSKVLTDFVGDEDDVFTADVGDDFEDMLGWLVEIRMLREDDGKSGPNSLAKSPAMDLVTPEFLRRVDEEREGGVADVVDVDSDVGASVDFEGEEHDSSVTFILLSATWW